MPRVSGTLESGGPGDALSMPSSQPPGDAPASPRRPSLIDGAAADAAPHKPLSILAALDGQHAAGTLPTPRRAWPWAVGLGTLAVALLATVLLSNTNTDPITPVAVAIPDTLQPALPAPGDAPAPAAAPPASAPAPQLAALEVLAAAPNALAGPVVAAVADAASTSTASEPGSASASAPAVPAASRKTPKDSGARTTATTRASGSKPQDKRQATDQNSNATRAVAKNSSGGAPAATRSATETKVTSPAAARDGNDADVDLIAALMQHLNREDAVDGNTPTTIADLVGRCKGLAAAEALRCQRRICDNYWGRAEACPRSLAPRDVAVRP